MILIADDYVGRLRGVRAKGDGRASSGDASRHDTTF